MPEPVPAPRFTLIDETGAASLWSAEAALGRIHAIARALAPIPAGGAIGLLMRSGAALIETWFACLHAGLRPLIVQYPTRKQSRTYWFESVTHTIATAELVAIVTDAYCADLGLPETVRILRHDTLPTDPVADPGPLLPADFAILQLSSGTTGYRKAMEFTAASLYRHAADFNQVLDLRPGRDRIVSWLPLYHDMGYVACFVMPILLGIEVVMMDSVDWVGNPSLLFDAIAAHQGTICYMPNFGFEVMARAAAPPMPSMRHWISCSEPVSATTAAKFCAHVGIPPALFSPCYAMAENLFAVSFGTGYDTRAIDGADVVGCGRPIANVAVKIKEGEIWVQSPTSLACYLGGQDITDADGYYPTGDMGALLDGELYIAGRKQDVLIQAGRKFMLSDIDLKLNETFPDIRGRAATLAIHDERLGTETPLILIEAADFFDRTDMQTIAATMIDLTGMDQIEVAYVPPRFLTKTSSGKVNRRKSRADWLAVQNARLRGGGASDPVAKLTSAYRHLDWSRPMREVLDSLGLEIAAITVQSSSVAFRATLSLQDLVDQINAARIAEPSEAPDSIRIVSLADRRVMALLNEDDLAAMSVALGCEVTFEHVCLPPSPVVMSDLVFHDWFQPRLDQEFFTAVDEAMERLKNASVILTDSFAEFHFTYASVYPVLSHNLERNSDADLLCFRWQNYTSQHHLLPVSFVTGADIPLEHANTSLRQISRYLGVPIYRLATLQGFAAFSSGWEWEAPIGNAKTERGQFAKDLAAWIADNPAVPRRERRPGPALIKSDPAHFCGIMARRGTVDQLVDRYDDFRIVAPVASLPYLRQKIERAGKTFALASSFTPEVAADFDQHSGCLVSAGSWGKPPPDLPMVAFQSLGKVDVARIQATDFGAGEAAGTMFLNAFPNSPRDGFFALALERSPKARRDWTERRAESARRFWRWLYSIVRRPPDADEYDD